MPGNSPLNGYFSFLPQELRGRVETAIENVDDSYEKSFETVENGGVCSVLKKYTSMDGAGAYTLADGTADMIGKQKFFKSLGGSCVVTPAHFSQDGTTFTCTSAQTAVLVWDGTDWIYVGGTATVN